MIVFYIFKANFVKNLNHLCPYLNISGNEDIKEYSELSCLYKDRSFQVKLQCEDF